MQKLLASLIWLLVFVGVEGKKTITTLLPVEEREESHSPRRLTIFERDVEPSSLVESANAEETGSQENQGEIFRCNICESIFTQRNLLQAHRRTHEPPSQVHFCRFCQRPFRTRQGLRLHQTTHRGAL